MDSKQKIISGFAHILLLVIVVVAVGAGGWWMWRNDKLNVAVESPTPTPPREEIQTPNSENNIPDGWESYEGKNYSFSYPSNWQVQKNLDDLNVPPEEQLIIINPERSVGVFITNFKPEFGVGGPNDPVQKAQIDISTKNNTYRADEITLESKSLGFLIADFDNGYIVTAGSHSIIPGIEDNTSYDVYLENIDIIMDILSTFDFIDSEQNIIRNNTYIVPVMDIVGWKKAKLDGIDFKVPSQAICRSDTTSSEEDYENCQYLNFDKENVVTTKFDVIPYTGGSRRKLFFDEYALDGYESCDIVFQESTFGSIDALEIAVNDCPYTDGGIVAVVNNKMFVKQEQFYHYQTRAITRYKPLDTIISTLKLKNE